MKIVTWIHPEPLEVAVEVSIEDICNALDESPETEREAFTLLNQCAVCMKAITPEIIARMSNGQREVIGAHLVEQASRYGQDEGCLIATVTEEYEPLSCGVEQGSRDFARVVQDGKTKEFVEEVRAMPGKFRIRFLPMK